MIAQALVSGLLIGFVFALIAAGLTLIFGVMEIVNFAHGEFLMLSMYLSYFLHAGLGWDPIAALPVNAIALFALGVIVYYALIRRVLRAPMLAQVFATFGLGVFLQNAAQFLWRPDFRTLGNTWVTGRIALAGVYVSGPQLAAAGGAVVTTAGLWWLLSRTEIGRAEIIASAPRPLARTERGVFHAARDRARGARRTLGGPRHAVVHRFAARRGGGVCLRTP